ncbi:predicted protein [Chaetoceros tenuissimus]|uniref:Uncharacterized protein n=1 Tax=Chaetoceros tenuissimus TaxID=426638 RepID=A0AAD3CXY9_9STRA|nr:predicted protein [Chaetoceros tenuissimus]GFH52634.1 predicted protein [Chaetoceros tenuissimus]
MERLDFSQILGVKNQLAKSCEYIDNALRLITSDVDLCRDCTYVKLFLCMKLNHNKYVPRWKIGDTSNCLRIPCGQSVDSFIKLLWVLEVEDPKLIAKNIHWTNFVMLLMQKPMVESIVSISPLLAVAIHKLNMRAEMCVIFCCGFFCGSYINGVTEKANAVSAVIIDNDCVIEEFMSYFAM